MTSITNLRTAMSPLVMPPKPEATATPYASYPEAYLAKLLAGEAPAIRARHKSTPIAEPAAPRAPRMSRKEISAAANAGKRRTWASRNTILRKRIMALLDKPMTCIGLGDAVCLCKSAVAGHLAQLKREGLVTSVKVGKANVWQRAERLEAAE